MREKLKELREALNSPTTPEEFKADLQKEIDKLLGDKRGRTRKYNIQFMEVDDYFEIEPNTPDQIQRVRASISQWKRMHDKKDVKFRILEMEDGNGGKKCVCVRTR